MRRRDGWSLDTETALRRRGARGVNKYVIRRPVLRLGASAAQAVRPAATVHVAAGEVTAIAAAKAAAIAIAPTGDLVTIGEVIVAPAASIVACAGAGCACKCRSACMVEAVGCACWRWRWRLPTWVRCRWVRGRWHKRHHPRQQACSVCRIRQERNSCAASGRIDNLRATHHVPACRIHSRSIWHHQARVARGRTR